MDTTSSKPIQAAIGRWIESKRLSTNQWGKKQIEYNNLIKFGGKIRHLNRMQP